VRSSLQGLDQNPTVTIGFRVFGGIGPGSVPVCVEPVWSDPAPLRPADASAWSISASVLSAISALRSKASEDISPRLNLRTSAPSTMSTRVFSLLAASLIVTSRR